MNKAITKKKKNKQPRVKLPRVRSELTPSSVCNKFISKRITNVSGFASNDPYVKNESKIQYNTHMLVLNYELVIDGLKLYVLHEDFREVTNSPDANGIIIFNISEDELFNKQEKIIIRVVIDHYGNTTYKVDDEELEKTSFINMTDAEKFQFSLICPCIDDLIKFEKCVQKVYNYQRRDEPTTIIKIMKNF